MNYSGSSRDDRSFTALISELTAETATLFRKEVALAKAELSQKAAQVRSGLLELVIGGVALFVAVQVLVAAAILGLALVVEWWLAALIVGLVILGIGAAVLSRGLAHLRTENIAPHRTMATLRENSDWAKEQMR